MILLSILSSIVFLSCGSEATPDRATTEIFQPVEVFVQGIGLDLRHVAFNSDDSRIVTSGGKGTTVWDFTARKEIKNVFKSEARSMACSKSGRYLITHGHSSGGRISICDFSASSAYSLEIVAQQDLLPGEDISGLSIADDEKHFVLATGGKIKVFNIETSQEINAIDLKADHSLFNYRRQGLSVIPGTNRLLSISYDCKGPEPDVTEAERESRFSVNTYDIGGREATFDQSFYSRFIYSWAISQGGKKLALLFMDKQVQIIDLVSGMKRSGTIQSDDDISAIGFSQESILTFAGREGAIGTYDIDRNQTTTIETDIRKTFGAIACTGLAVSGNGSTVAFCNSYEKLIVYDLPSGRISVMGDPAKSVLGTYYGSDASLNVLTPNKAYRQNGSNVNAQELKIASLVSIFTDQVRIDNAKTGMSEVFDASVARTIYSGKFDNDLRSYAAFTQDGQFAFFWNRTLPGNETDRCLYIANLSDATASPVRLEGSDDYGFSLRVSGDNKRVIISGEATETLGMWDMQTGKLLGKLNEQSGNARAFEYIDNNRCLVGTRGNVKLYDLSNSTVLKTYTPDTYNGNERDIEKIAFSKDRTSFATGDSWGRVTIWTFDKEHEVLSFDTHKGEITSLAFTPDGRQLVSGSRNGKSAVVCDVSTGKQLATFVSFTDGEWIIITPEGYFNASPDGAKYLNVRIGSSVYAIDNFYEKFFNPSYIASVLQGKTDETAADLRKGFALPPRVKIVSPRANTVSASDAITVEISAKDMGGGIDEIRLFQNGKLVSGDRRGMKKAGAIEETVTQSYRLTLLSGINTFRAVAFNRERTESNPDEITVELKGAQAASDLHLFAIGINEYRNSKYNLNYGKSDATAFLKAVAGRSGAIFKQVFQYQLYDGEATRPTIEGIFRQIAASAKPQDTFVFFYAGHGVMSEGSASVPPDFYLIPTDVTSLYGDEPMLAAKAIAAAQLKTFCTAIKAQKQLVVLDACQSGGAVASFATRGASEERAIMQLARSAGTVLLASTGTEQFATEFSTLAHGVFTYALLQGLNGEADGGNPKDGKVTVKELEAYLNDQVPELTKKYRGTAQYPTSYARGQDFPLGVK
jgi:WD40 repeat protein